MGDNGEEAGREMDGAGQRAVRGSSGGLVRAVARRAEARRELPPPSPYIDLPLAPAVAIHCAPVRRLVLLFETREARAAATSLCIWTARTPHRAASCLPPPDAAGASSTPPGASGHSSSPEGPSSPRAPFRAWTARRAQQAWRPWQGWPAALEQGTYQSDRSLGRDAKCGAGDSQIPALAPLW
uniref:Uncharacterized protein n=1 Tax=Oryza meridionalis TaxID=40149 RepID=A0A0E0E0N2_9ORYZ